MEEGSNMQSQIKFQRAIIGEEAAQCMSCPKQGRCQGICDQVTAEILDKDATHVPKAIEGYTKNKRI